MFGDVEVNNATALMRQHDEQEEHSAFDGGYRKKITGDDIFEMIGPKSPIYKYFE